MIFKIPAKKHSICRRHYIDNKIKRPAPLNKLILHPYQDHRSLQSHF